MADIQYRPVASPGFTLMKYLLEGINDNIERITCNGGFLVFTSQTANLVSLQLRLYYVLNILTRCLQTKRGEGEDEKHVAFELEKLLKSSLIKTVVKFVFILNCYMATHPTNSLGTVSEIFQDLWTLLCLPVYISRTKTSEVVTVLTQELGAVNSTDERIRLLQYIPSNLLLERVIDLHLEKHFQFHESAHKLYNTHLYECSDSGLTKLCCVHLCRKPSREMGGLHYLLFLLCTLLHSILLRETGSPVVNVPSLISLESELFAKTQLVDVFEFQGALASVKSHVLQFIDSLTENATLLEELIQRECWYYLHLLGNMTDLILHQQL